MSTSLMKTMPALQTEYLTKVQPRSSAERENSVLLQTALKAASSDMAHRLLDYASLDKVDCEASCILIALANHDPNRPVDSRPKKDIQQEKEESNKEQQEEEQKQPVQEKPTEVVVVKENKDVTQQTHPKNDPIMLLMAAAEVVNNDDDDDILLNKQHQDGGYEKRRKYHNYPSRDIRLLPSRRSIDDDERKAYPNGRYYRKAEDQNKRIRTSPPTPAPTHQPDTWRRKSGHKSDHRSTKDDIGSNNISTMKSNTFSRQYHSMKQNPKVKQNALHAYITYMIYNDLAHGRKQSFDSKPDDTKFVNPMPPQDNQFNSSPFNHYAGGANGNGSIIGNGSMNGGSGNVGMNGMNGITTTTTAAAAAAGSNGSVLSAQRRSTDPVNLPQLTPNSTSTAPSQTELVADSHTNSSSSSHASMSPWYNSRIHPPPPPSIPIHDERSIISRPLTAFLWKDTSSTSSVNSASERKEMMILPPLSSRPSPNPSISTYDRLPPL